MRTAAPIGGPQRLKEKAGLLLEKLRPEEVQEFYLWLMHREHGSAMRPRTSAQSPFTLVCSELSLKAAPNRPGLDHSCGHMRSSAAEPPLKPRMDNCMVTPVTSVAPEASTTTTTLIVRTNPPMNSQTAAMEWLSQHGFECTYDFLFWIPSGSCQNKASKAAGCFFVNFCEEVHACRLFELEKSFAENSKQIKVMVPRKQGLEALRDHFCSLGGKVAPWVRADENWPGGNAGGNQRL